jgi:hypothetical protein
VQRTTTYEKLERYDIAPAFDGAYTHLRQTATCSMPAVANA